MVLGVPATFEHHEEYGNDVLTGRKTGLREELGSLMTMVSQPGLLGTF